MVPLKPIPLGFKLRELASHAPSLAVRGGGGGRFNSSTALFEYFFLQFPSLGPFPTLSGDEEFSASKPSLFAILQGDLTHLIDM